MKNEKNYIGFHIPKVWQILKHLTGTFHQACVNLFFLNGAEIPKKPIEQMFFMLFNLDFFYW